MRFPQTDGGDLILPEACERNGILGAGATGSGKTTLILRMLKEWRVRGVRFVVYDPTGDYTAKLFRPGLDTMGNPLDARFQYWPLDELKTDAEAMSIATALIPRNSQEKQPFYLDAPRAIVAFLLRLKRTRRSDWTPTVRYDRPNPEQLIEWVSDMNLLRALLREEPNLYSFVNPRSEAMAGGVQATLGIVANVLRLLPTREEAQGSFSVRDWIAREDDSCLFLTSTPETREALAPILSILMDLLILRSMHGPITQPGLVFVLDELASMTHLSQLHTAVTELRKFNRWTVIGVQDPTQLERIYLGQWKTIVSQQATRFFLRLKDDAAQWAAKAMGDVEEERQHQSRKDGWGVSWDSVNLTQQLETKPVLLASQFAALHDRRGYVESPAGITAVSFEPDNDWPRNQPIFVPRTALRPRVVPPKRSTAPLPPAPPPSPAAPAPPTRRPIYTGPTLVDKADKGVTDAS